MKQTFGSGEIAYGRAKPFQIILELLYMYKYEDEPDYNMIKFMFEKIILAQNIVPSIENLDWISPSNKHFNYLKFRMKV